MNFIDTHTHLYSEEFLQDQAEVIQRARNAGVQQFVLPAIDKESFSAMMQLVEKYPDICYPCIGLHPTSVKANWKEELDFVEEKLRESKSFVSIGEIGIDCYWSKEFLEEQKIVFETQLRWAAQYDLPVIIHARNSFHEIFAILDKLKHLSFRGVFHAFSGSSETYSHIRRHSGLKIGIGGVVTFKNAGLATVLKNADLGDLVLETDAPWLTPQPHRGQRNESSYITFVAQKIAEVKEMDVEKIAEITTYNARQLFRF